MRNTDKAFALANLGLRVFPCDRKTRAPLTERGFYNATTDGEQIATWFDGLPEETTVVGVWMGASGLIAADIDRGKKNGKNGFESLASGNLQVTDTFGYVTASGGAHHIYAADRDDLAPDSDIRVGGVKLEGVDVRAGGSYIVWWGDEVPVDRSAFSTDVPDWLIEAASKDTNEFTGEGFSGGVGEWLKQIDQDVLPSAGVRNFMANIPTTEFGHSEMVELAWQLVRLGSERETGIKGALMMLQDAWLREPFNTAKNRRDFDVAMKGGINKGGRIQNPLPGVIDNRDAATESAKNHGVWKELGDAERKVSGNSTEADFARARKEIFAIAAKAGMPVSAALGMVSLSKSFRNSVVSLESAWFSDGEPLYHDDEPEGEIAEDEEEARVEREAHLAEFVGNLNKQSQSFTFLTEAEASRADAYDWFGKEYLAWVAGRLKHFNRPYHVSTLWTALSVIVGDWGKVRSRGAAPMDCNLYIGAFGQSTSGKTEAMIFGIDLIDAVYGKEESPIIADISKTSALAIHRSLVKRDKFTSLIYGDEVQSFFKGVGTTQWQTGILGDISGYYGGNVSPKNTLNDKDLAGQRADTVLTVYLTGIADQMLEAIGYDHWTSGLFYRILWSFGEPRREEDDDIEFGAPAASYTAQLDLWADQFKSRREHLAFGPGGLDREVDWEADALKRLNDFKRQIKTEVRSHALFDTIFAAANIRFMDSILKVATIIALTEAADKVTLDHVLVAISFAGPWHKSMVLAVSETGRDPFLREKDDCYVWIVRNAIRQVDKKPWIQRSAVMQYFEDKGQRSEMGDQVLRQLTETGKLLKNGDKYELTEG